MTAPKRILYVENGIGYGGAIICLRQLVRNLDQTQYTPMVVTGRTGPQYQEICQEALWKHIPDKHIDIVSAHRKLDPISWIDKIPGLRFIINQMLARSDDLFNFLPFLLNLLWTAWRFKADLIHANNEPLCNRAALLVGKALKIPTVCHVRGEQDGSRLMSWAFNLPTHFIPVSYWVSKNIQNKLNIPQNKITTIYDGLEMSRLEPHIDGTSFRQQHNLKKDDFVVGLVGLLIPWKGQEIFLDAAKILKDKIPNLKMAIIGGTPKDFILFEHQLRQRTEQEGLKNIVQFTGHISDIPSVYSGLDIMVSASTSPEPLGIVCIEAMAMCKAVIGPDHGGAVEIIEHEKTGLLFRAKSAKSLAKMIENLHQSKEKREQLGQTAREHVLKKFAVEAHVTQMQSVYAKLLG